MSWYNKEGRDSDVIVSSRVRIARNLADYPFEPRLTAEAAGEIIDRVGDALGEGYEKTDFTEISPVAAYAYAEKNLVSPEFAAKKTPHALYSDDENGVAVMVCEEDHIRLQCILPGSSLDKAYENAAAVEKKLDERLNLAYDERLGYLTHCPTNLGTALRVSVMMFLPAITWARETGALQAQLSKLGLTVRGVNGEGSAADGCLYQISNRVTLGVSEEETVKKINDVAAAIAERERKIRASYTEGTLMKLRDRVRRSLGTLAYAELLSTEEFMNLYTDVRLGIALGICDGYGFPDIDGLLADVRPASLAMSEKLTEIPADSYERDKARANLVRERIRR